jgi:hypothetical protein
MSPEGKPKEEVTNKVESLSIKEEAKEEGGEDEEGMLVYPYDRLKTNSDDPVTDIDITKREVQILPSYFTHRTIIIATRTKENKNDMEPFSLLNIPLLFMINGGRERGKGGGGK